MKIILVCAHCRRELRAEDVSGGIFEDTIISVIACETCRDRDECAVTTRSKVIQKLTENEGCPE